MIPFLTRFLEKFRKIDFLIPIIIGILIAYFSYRPTYTSICITISVIFIASCLSYDRWKLIYRNNEYKKERDKHYKLYQDEMTKPWKDRAFGGRSYFFQKLIFGLTMLAGGIIFLLINLIINNYGK